MATQDEVRVRIGLENAARFQADARRASQSVDELADANARAGDSARDAGDELNLMQRSVGKLAAGLKIGGAALGAAFAGALVGAVQREEVNSKLAAQLDLSSRGAATAGKLAGKIYAQNYGDGLEDVNGAIRSLAQNLGISLNGGNIEGFSKKLLNLSSAFGTESDDVTQAINAMVKNGLAPNIDAAFDLITRGFQKGADRGGEFLDTLNEYAQPVKALGLSAADFTSTISRGFDAGVQSADILGDAIKEFGIRATDGSKGTVGAFHAIGLSANDTAAAIAAGGPRAKKAFSDVIKGLAGMKDPLERRKAAVALFGSQFEDTSIAAIKSLRPLQTGLGKVKGAADRMDKTLGQTSGATLEAFKRKFTIAMTDAAAAAINFAKNLDFDKAGDAIMSVVRPARDLVRWLTGTSDGAVALQSAMAALAVPLLLVAARLALVRTQMMAMAIVNTVTAAISRLRGVWIALNLVMAANPVGAVIVGIAALAAAFYVAYRRSETFRNVVDAIFGFIKSHWPLLAGVITGGIVPAVVLVVRHFDDIKSAAHGVYSSVARWFGSIVGFISGMPGRIGKAASGMFDGIKSAFTSAINYIIGAWNGLNFHIGGTDLGPLGHLPDINIGTPDIPLIGAKALGGPIGKTGPYLVGERGPEIVTLRSGQTVIPNNRIRMAAPAMLAPDTRGMTPSVSMPATSDGRERPIVVHNRQRIVVMVPDGRVLAELVDESVGESYARL